MLIVCSGPDTYCAVQKARELERAFAEKFDKQAFSIERLASGKDAVDELLSQVSTPSLFAPRRFFRANDLIALCPKAKLTSLLSVLKKDPEGAIVVSLEQEPMKAEQKKLFTKEMKFVEYPFPLMQGAAFVAWARDVSLQAGIIWNESLQILARETDGDTWDFVNEMQKLAAGGTLEKGTRLALASVYEVAEKFVRGDGSHYKNLFAEKETQDPTPLLISQSRSAIRVRDGFTDGIHPFVVKKMKNVSGNNLEKRLQIAINAQIKQRSGLLSGKEISSIL